MSFEELRKEVYETTMLLCENDLIRLSAGNISASDGKGHIAITPAGLRYDRMKPEDISIVDPDGNLVDGEHKPSSETPMHTAIFRGRPDVGGVVHTHSVNAIAFASTGVELPVTCIEILAVGGPVPVAPYACPGSTEAGEIAVAYFKERPQLKVLMLRNHGLVAIGKNVYDAYQNAYKFETGAEVYYRALGIGTPIVLTDEQIEEIYRIYRRPAPVQA